MGKPNLRSLNPMDFTKMNPARQERIASAPAAPLPALETYAPNRVAMALHPAVQYLKVAKLIPQTKDTVTYVLAPDPDRGTEKLAWFSAGQYLSVTLDINGKTLTRPYSLSSSPRESLAGEYAITVKRAEDGLASRFIHDNWAVGTPVTASEPLGFFTYEPLRDAKTIIGIAGGAGVTPFRSLAKSIADGDEDASLILLYGSRTLADAAFQEEFKALEKTCPKFKLVNVLSEETVEGCEQGFITAALIRKYAPQGEPYSVFLCGPQAMYAFVDKEIETLGLRRKFIRHEVMGEFFHPEKEADYPGGVPEKVSLTVHVNGETRTLTAPTGTSILRTLEENGIPAPAHCRSGECGWCHSRLVTGEVYTPKSVDGRREADLMFGYIHPCCAFPLTDLEIEVPPVRK